jgi:hypothetical protein
LAAATELAGQLFMVGTQMGIPPEYWVPYIMKDVLRIADEDLATMPIDPAQIKAVQDQQNADQDAAGGEGGDDSDEKKGRREARRQLLRNITEKLQDEKYLPLKEFLAGRADTPDNMLFPEESELPPGPVEGGIEE